MIQFTCPACQSKLNAKDNLAGQSRKCPKCGAEVRIPLPENQAASAGREEADALAGPAIGAIKIEAIQEGLPRFQAPKTLARGNRYLICDRSSVVAVWSDGSGWMVKTNTGLQSAARNPDLLPVEGSFELVELLMTRSEEGLRLEGIRCYAIATRWALLALGQAEDKILGKLTGEGSLNRDQKTAVLGFLKEHFMPEVWEGSQKVRDFLTNIDYVSSGTE